MKNKGPKIAIVGAGSYFFGRKLIWAMNRLEGLTDGHLALVDIDPQTLETMRRLAEKAKEGSKASYTVSASTDFREALPDADFVILSFSNRNAHYRGIDVNISAESGIRMCSGDTIGPGGVFRTLREFPQIMEIAKVVETACPSAWLINYINPSSVFGIALSKYTKTKSLALCDSLHLPNAKYRFMELIGLDRKDLKDFSMRVAGVNHFTWMLECSFKGEDMMPRIHTALRHLGQSETDDLAKAAFNKRIAAKLADVYGAIPVCVAHTKEYLPYWQGYGPLVEIEDTPPLKLFEHEYRQSQTDTFMQENVDYGSGKLPIAEFHEKEKSDHATDLIQAIWNDSGRHLYVNVPNRGAVSNMADDALLELECICDKNGADPIPAPEMPVGLNGLQRQILDTHELTVEACIKKDRSLLLRALAVDPIVNSLAAAEKALVDLYEAEKEALEDWVAPPEQGESSEKLSFTPSQSVDLGMTEGNR